MANLNDIFIQLGLLKEQIKLLEDKFEKTQMTAFMPNISDTDYIHKQIRDAKVNIASACYKF